VAKTSIPAALHRRAGKVGMLARGGPAFFCPSSQTHAFPAQVAWPAQKGKCLVVPGQEDPQFQGLGYFPYQFPFTAVQ
jgi:hypothetical protein